MKTIRQDKYQPGDRVRFIHEDEYTGSGIEERHRTKYGKGPYEVEEVEDAGGLGSILLHTQLVNVNGETFSGAWFEPCGVD